MPEERPSDQSSDPPRGAPRSKYLEKERTPTHKLDPPHARCKRGLKNVTLHLRSFPSFLGTSVEDPRPNARLEGIHLRFDLVAHVAIQIDDQIPNERIRRENLGGHIRMAFGDDAVDLGKHPRHVVMNVQNSVMSRGHRLSNLGKVHRPNSQTAVEKVCQTPSYFAPNVLLGF